MFQKNRNMSLLTITEMLGENRLGKRKYWNSETIQKVTDAELLNQLKKLMHNLKRGRKKVRIVKMPSTVNV